jgi:DNA-directed RNA polymerase specialized sigma24 family protein
MTTSSNEPPEHESSDWFVTTRWTVVRTASGPTSVLAQEALQRLCTAYWPPLYAYVRRKGHGEHEAQDLTQEFFARLLARNDFAGLDPGRGRFRAFLLASMNHFLAKEWRKAATLKRGAGQPAVSLDTVLAERCYATLASVEATPERLFDRRWAETILESAGNRLRAEFVSQGNDAIFRDLNTFLSVPPGSGDYAAVAVRLNTTEAAVAKSVERLRRRYRELVRDEIAQTVSTPAELQEELRYLLEVMA